MSPRSFRRPGLWVAIVLSSLSLVTGISFTRAQQVGGSVPTFRPGGGIPVRGVPMQQRPQGVSFPGPNGSTLGPYPVPVAVMPNKPIASKGFGQVPTNPNNFGIQGSSALQQGAQGGGALGAGGVSGGGAGGIAGGAGGIAGGVSGGIAGGASSAGISGGGVAGFGGMPAQGQNFQNPTGNFGFPQTPVNYIGGTTGGGITGAGIAGNAGQQGVQGATGVQGASGNSGAQGGIGGFGGGGFGGGIKGIAGAGINGI